MAGCNSCGGSSSTTLPAVTTTTTTVVTTAPVANPACPGRTPFFDMYRASSAPYPKNSIVYDECGFYALPCGPEYAPPRAPGSKWVAFGADVFVNLIKYGVGDACSFMFPRTSSDDTDPFCLPNFRRVWGKGEIRCHNGYLHCSRKIDNASDPAPNGAESSDWTRGMPAAGIICSVLRGPLVRTALGFADVQTNGEDMQVIDWLYDSARGLGVDTLTNRAYVKLTNGGGLGFAGDGSIKAMIDNETIIIEGGRLKAVQKDPFDALEICDNVDPEAPPVDFWDDCHTVPALAGGCSIKKLGATTDSSGCTRVGWYSDSTLELVSGGSEAAPAGTVERWPLDPADHALYYDYPTLHDDNVANTIDTAKLSRTKLACFVVDVPCNNMSLQLDIGATVTFDPDNQGISRFVVSIDGVFPRNAAGETIALAYFTSYEGTTNPTLPLSLSTGQHTLCLYVVGGSKTKNMAQVTVQNTAGAKRPVYSVSRRIA